MHTIFSILLLKVYVCPNIIKYKNIDDSSLLIEKFDLKKH